MDDATLPLLLPTSAVHPPSILLFSLFFFALSCSLSPSASTPNSLSSTAWQCKKELRSSRAALDTCPFPLFDPTKLSTTPTTPTSTNPFSPTLVFFLHQNQRSRNVHHHLTPIIRDLLVSLVNQATIPHHHHHYQNTTTEYLLVSRMDWKLCSGIA